MANQEYFAGSPSFPAHPEGPPPAYQHSPRPSPQPAPSYGRPPPQPQPSQQLYGAHLHPDPPFNQPHSPYPFPQQVCSSALANFQRASQKRQQFPPPNSQQQPQYPSKPQPPQRPHSHSPRPRPPLASHQATDYHDRKHRHSHKTREKRGNSDTFLGAAGGGLLGDVLIGPGVGTLGGALIGALGGHKHGEKRDERKSRRSRSRSRGD
ncbi:MAG: hypothetical protein Q9216_005130 [Gyalolechia sp. 2 TL-2023]